MAEPASVAFRRHLITADLGSGSPIDSVKVIVESEYIAIVVVFPMSGARHLKRIGKLGFALAQGILESLALRYIQKLGDEILRPSILVSQQGDVDIGPDHLAIFAIIATHEAMDLLLSRQQTPHALLARSQIIWVNHVGQSLARQFLSGVSK